MRAPRLGGALGGVKRLPGAVSDGFGRLVDAAAERPVRAIRVLGATVAVLAVLAGLFAWQAQRYAGMDAARAEALEQGKRAVVKLMSYNFRTVEDQVANTQDLITGDFKDQYADLVAKNIAGGAKDKQISVQTQVLENAVVEDGSDHMVLLMFLDQESGSKLKGDTQSTVSRMRVTVDRDADRWLVSELKPV
jgi:Mce-associated membrane protein